MGMVAGEEEEEGAGSTVHSNQGDFCGRHSFTPRQSLSAAATGDGGEKEEEKSC